MPTVEELLIGFKIDEGSVQKLSSDTKKTTDKISSDSKIDVKLTTNANDILAKVSDAIKQFKTELQDSFSKMGSGVTDVGKEFDKLQSSITSIFKPQEVTNTIKELANDSNTLASATTNLDQSAKALNNTQAQTAVVTNAASVSLGNEKKAIDGVTSTIAGIGPAARQTSSQIERLTGLMRSLGLGSIPGLRQLIDGMSAYRNAMLLSTTAVEANSGAVAANNAAMGINGPILRGLVTLFPTFSSALGINTKAYIAESGAIALNTNEILKNKAARIAAEVEQESAFALGQGFLAGASDKDIAKMKEFLTETKELGEESVTTTAKVGLLASAWSKLITLLGTSVTSLGTVVGLTGALAVAFTALAAAVAAVVGAIAGWSIGRWISDLLGLDDATERVVKGTSNWLDKLKTLGVVAITGPLAPLTAGILAYNAAVAKAARDTQKLNEEAGKNLLSTIPGAREEFERLTKEGLKFNQAFSQAIDLTLENKKQQGRLRFEYLKVLAAENSLTEAQKKEYALLSYYLNPALKEEAANLEKVDKALDVKKLEESQKLFTEAVAKTNDELIKQTRGKTVFDVKELQDEFNKRLKVIKEFSDLQVNIVNAAQEELAKAGSNPEAISRATSIIEDAQTNINEARAAAVNLEISFSAQISGVIKDRIAELQSLADKEIDIERSKADKIISEQNKIINATQDELKKLVEIRKQGIQTFNQFMEQLGSAELARESPIRAELDKFVRDSLVKLSKSTFENQKQVEKFFDEFGKGVDRISNKIKVQISTAKDEVDDLIFALAQIKKENAAIAAKPLPTTQEGFESTLREIAENRRQAQELQGKLVDAEKKYNALLEQGKLLEGERVQAMLDASDAADQNLKNQKKFAMDIIDNQERQKVAEEAIKKAEEGRILNETRILELLEQQKATYWAIAAAAQASGGVKSAELVAPVVAPVVGKEPAKVQAAAQAAAVAQQQTALNAEVLKGKADEITRGFMDVAAKIGPLFTAMAASLDSAVKSLTPITEKFSLLLASQASFGVSLTSFSESVVSKIELLADTLNGQASRLDTLTARVDKIVLRRGNNEDIPAAGALPV